MKKSTLYIGVMLVIGLFTAVAVVLSRPFLNRTENEVSQKSTDENVPVVFPAPVASPPPIPLTKTLSGVTHAFQTFNNCGPASLSMAFSYFDIPLSQQTLGRELRPYQNSEGDNDDKSVTLAELAERAKESGLLVYHRPAGDIQMLEKMIAANIPVVTRTWLKPSEDIGHYRVVKGYDQTTRQLLQDDSLQGKDLWYDYQDFADLWQAFNYEFLVLVPPEKRLEVEQILGARLDEEHAWRAGLAAADAQISRNNSDVYAHFNRSVALYYLGEYEAAVAAYEQVASTLPSRMLWYQIEPILAYYQLGQFDRVMGMSQDILNNRNRAFSELYYLQGLIHRAEGRQSEADRAFALATQYNPTQYWKVNVSVN